MSDMMDMKGWDEVSAYSWLNSKQGKETIGWPLDEVVPLKVVREYIAQSNPGPRMEPVSKLTVGPEVMKNFPVIEQPKMSDLEYLMEPLTEFADRILDLIRIGLQDDETDG